VVHLKIKELCVAYHDMCVCEKLVQDATDSQTRKTLHLDYIAKQNIYNTMYYEILDVVYQKEKND